MLRAVPSMILIGALEIGGIQIRHLLLRNLTQLLAFVIFPTLSFCGTPDPLMIPAAFFKRSDAGGVFIIKVNDRSL